MIGRPRRKKKDDDWRAHIWGEHNYDREEPDRKTPGIGSLGEPDRKTPGIGSLGEPELDRLVAQLSPSRVVHNELAELAATLSVASLVGNFRGQGQSLPRETLDEVARQINRVIRRAETGDL